MDGGTQERQRQEEVQASQQGPLHLQDVPARGLCHCGPEEPAHRWQVGASSLLSELAPWLCKDLPSVVEIIKPCVFSSGFCLFPRPRERNRPQRRVAGCGAKHGLRPLSTGEEAQSLPLLGLNFPVLGRESSCSLLCFNFFLPSHHFLLLLLPTSQ